jgi:putative ABC transport system substrate-binding protein
MNRREVIALVSVVVAAAIPARAQQPAKQHRIAIVNNVVPVDRLNESGPYWVRRFFEELRRLGYVEGRNLVVERYSAEGHPERYRDLARQVTERNPDLIVAYFSVLARAIMTATTTIPIVVEDGDPILAGLTTNIAHPGGNVTGVSVDAGFEVSTKRLQILKEIVPTATKVGFLGPRENWRGAAGPLLRDAGHALGITVVDASVEEQTVDELRRSFAEMAQQGVDGVLVGAAAGISDARSVVQLAEEYRLPLIYPFRGYVEAGGLVAYATDLREAAEHLASSVARILDGDKPGEIPFYLATKFELLINLKAANAIGLTVPQVLLARADEVIE